MRRIDALFLRWPFLGSRRIVAPLAIGGIRVNRKRVRRLMRLMGIEALALRRYSSGYAAGTLRAFPKPWTSKLGVGHKIYRYLLRDLVIDRPDQVWCADIPYLPIGRGEGSKGSACGAGGTFANSAWRISNTMDTEFCVSAIEEALARFGRPEIFNTDQGSQFTSTDFTGMLAAAGIRISMDGKGRWMDNVFIERLWRSLKYEDLYIKGYANGAEARAGIALMDELLQSPATAPGAGQPGGAAQGSALCAWKSGGGADGGLARDDDRHAAADGCEYDASLG